MKSAKAAFVALLIVLSLLLGGCYVEPNNIATGNQNSDNLNFPVYQPDTPQPTTAPVILPTDLPTDTPEQTYPIANNQGLIVGLPTTSASNWMTVAPMVTSVPSTNNIVTPAPTAKPTATPGGSLKLGSQGQDVRNLQTKLKALGFYKGSVDGDFGEGTEKAVKAFQKQYGLTVDGKVGSATMAKLAAAKATAKPTVSPTPRPTATPAYSTNTYLRNGNSGKQVRQMQERLISLGYLVGKATSNFDNATEAGVIAFQRRNTSYADGVAGPETLKALYSSSAKKASSAAGVIGVSLKAGSTEKAAVRLLQQKLKSLGYYKGSVDGSFGVGTEDAVKAFQRNNGLTADGVAGGGTLNKLFASSAKSYSATATPRPTATPTPTPRPSPTPIPDNIYVVVTSAPYSQYATLRRGMRGAPVEEMQKALRSQGYFTGKVDGYFGEDTENAVKQFQRYNGLNIDGVAGPATLRTLLEGPYPFGS
jgi:peptidoglycan hydrolase-like protein with peptidoglycan-binding domain